MYLPKKCFLEIIRLRPLPERTASQKKRSVRMITKEKNREASPSRTYVVKSCDRLLKFIEKEIDKIDSEKYNKRF